MKSTEKSPVTIKTIANELNISFSTVAKALNDDPRIKEKTRNRVQKKAEEMGYFPNAMAKSLRSNATQNIALILNDIENPSLANIFGKITKSMDEYGYSTLICDSQYDLKIEAHNISTVLSRKPDAVIISPVTSDPSKLRLLKSMINQVIILGDTIDKFYCNYVHVDYTLGGYLSAKEMLTNGHTRNMIITEPDYCPISTHFLSGIKKAYLEFGIQIDNNLVCYCTPSIENGYQQLMNNFNQETGELKNNFTGVIASCDSIAYGIYKAAATLGLSIPKDISVIGFDDYSLSSFANPPLTTINLPTERIATRCTDILYSKLIDKIESNQIFSIEPHLIKRMSVKNLTENY